MLFRTRYLSEPDHFFLKFLRLGGHPKIAISTIDSKKVIDEKAILIPSQKYAISMIIKTPISPINDVDPFILNG